MELFLKYWDALSTGSHDLRKTDLGECKITLKEGSEPFKAAARPLNPIQIKYLKRQIGDWSVSEVIEPSFSPWSSPLVPVRKKGTDQYHWTVDYRRLNSMTVADSFPLPHCDESLAQLAGS